MWQEQVLFNSINDDTASLAGRKHEELAEMLDESKLLSGQKLPLMERLKLLIYKTLQKHAFIAIFLLASVITLHNQ